MTEKQKRSARRFRRGMLIYALIFLVALLILLRFQWRFLASYEESGPEKAMEHYLDSMDEAHIRTLADDLLQRVDERFQSREQAFAAVKEVLGGELRYVKKSADVDLRHETYAIRSGENQLGTVGIVRGEDPAFGFAPWEVEREDIDLGFLLDEAEICVPEDWTVRVGGTELDDGFRTEEGIPFALLEDYYEDERFTLPRLARYRVEGIVGKPVFTLYDAEGREVPAAAAESEYAMLANCTDTEQQEIRTLLDGFLQRYIDCLSNASRDVYGNYSALRPYILAGSDIDRRVRDNMEGQTWAHSNGDTVTARDDLLLMDLGGGYYLAELDYTLDTVGNKGHVETVNRIRVIMSRTDDGLKVVEIFSL